MHSEHIDINKIYVIKGLTERLDCLERKQDQILEKVGALMATLDQILAKVTEQDTRLDGVRELIVGLRKQVKDLLEQIGKLSPEDQAKVDAIFAQAEKNSAEIDEAITENTPDA